MRLSSDGIPSMSAASDATPYYLEAEINSPMCRLKPGENCTLETEWFPTRSGNEFHGVTDASILVKPLQATQENDKVRLSGSFGVFFAGHLIARFYDEHGSLTGSVRGVDVNPAELVSLDSAVVPTGKAIRVSLHLVDENGLDRGSLGEVRIADRDNR